jgi:hypothetical protein
VSETFLGIIITHFCPLIKVIAIASTALENFKNDAKKMVVALVDMERAFVPPQHFIRLVQRRSVPVIASFFIICMKSSCVFCCLVCYYLFEWLIVIYSFCYFTLFCTCDLTKGSSTF